MAAPNGGDRVAKQLAARGITKLFTLCGGHISPILVAAKSYDIDVIDVRDEASAVFAADAVARLTGIPGVAAVTAGPGVTNTITAIKNAQMAETPLLLIGGATPTILKGRGALQDIDQLSMMETITKWATSVSTVSALGPTIERALKIATEGVPGPVFVEIPVDLLYAEELVTEWYMTESGVEKMPGLAGKALGLYLKGHLARQFHAPHMRINLRPPMDIKLPFGADTDAQITEAANTLARAERPVLIIGSQALTTLDPAQAHALADAVRELGMPTFLGGASRGLLGKESDIQFRHKRTAALKRADVVLVAGFPFDFRLGYGQKIGSRATVIAANLSATDLRKNRKPEIGVLTHPADFLTELSVKLKGRNQNWSLWFDELTKNEDARNAEIAEQAKDVTELVNPLYFFTRLEKLLPDDSILIVDGGDFCATGSYILSPRGPQSWLDPGVFGTLGVGGGFAVGAAAARPDSEIWLIYGDGSSAYSLAEFDTCVRHGLAPIAVIGTDASWAQIAREQVEILNDDVGTTLLRTDYHKVAEGYGAVGLLVTEAKDVDKAIKKAQKLAAKGTPVCINLHIAGSDFRKGSISM